VRARNSHPARRDTHHTRAEAHLGLGLRGGGGHGRGGGEWPVDAVGRGGGVERPWQAPRALLPPRPGRGARAGGCRPGAEPPAHVVRRAGPVPALARGGSWGGGAVAVPVACLGGGRRGGGRRAEEVAV
jgi:hypothetical protein